MELQFEWDDYKAQLNIEKLGVSFEEAKTVFNDPLAYIFDDELHSRGQRREIIIGHCLNHPLLLVCFIEKDNGIIRIFSSRLTTKKERKDYKEYKQF